MYEIRKPLYARFADLLIINDTTPEEAAEKIAALLSKEETL